MKILHCPKGGRIPEGYCIASCLNYPCLDKGKRVSPFQRSEGRFTKKQKSWLQIYKEDILPRLKAAC